MSRDLRRAALAAVAIAWTLALLVSFLLNRGEDVGHLPTLLGALLASLRHSPVLSAQGLARSAGGLIIAGLVVLAWYGLGDLIRRAAPKGGAAPAGVSGAAEGASRCLYGAGAWSLIWFALGIAHCYRSAAAIVALGIGIGLAAIARPSLRSQSLPPATDTLARLIARGAIGMALALALASALAPPTARDALFYHFAIPKAYITAGGNDVVPYNMATFYPQLVEMQIVWAMLAGQPAGGWLGEAAAGATIFAFAPLLLLLVYGWAREQGLDPGWATLAALMVAAVPTIYEVSGSGYVDHALAAYTTLAVRAFARWWATLDRAWTVPVALGVAGTLSIKLTAIFFLLPLAVFVLARALGSSPASAETSHRSTARIVGAGLGALGLGATLAAPWYVSTWVRTGSPVFPFYLDIWPGAALGWDPERSRLYRELLSLYGDARAPLDYLVAPLRLALAAQPDQPGRYDGVLGFAFLLALPLLGWALVRRRIAPDLRVAALISGAMFVVWLFASQQIRFLLPALPGLAVAMAAAGSAAGADDPGLDRLFRWLLTAATVAGVAVSLAWFAELDPVRVVLGAEARRDYLTRRLDYYPYYETINRDLPTTSRVWLINMRRDTYHLDRPYFSDFVFEDYTLTRNVRDTNSAAEIRARAAALGITHLLVRHDVLFDYAHSSIVDDRQSREHNLAKLALAAAFFREGTRLLRGDQKFWLIELLPPGARQEALGRRP